jgi:outer membrane murein-binding lipoprotein Lpp
MSGLMNRVMLAAILLGASLAASAADDPKVLQLEQDVRDLQRQVLAQSQQIEQLRMQLSRPVPQPAPASPAASREPGASGTGGTWLDASRWAQIKPGMSELEVLTLLGSPASMRERDGERVLLYAMEIGSSGFLSGSVTLRNRVVLRLQKPELR